MKTVPRFACSMCLALLIGGALAALTLAPAGDGGGTPAVTAASVTAATTADEVAPVALAADREGKYLYVACALAPRIVVLDLASGKVSRQIALPEPAGSLLLSPDGKQLLVGGAGAAGKVYVADLDKGSIAATLAVGHTPAGLAVAGDGSRLYVCNRFDNDLSVLDLSAAREIARVPLIREPIALALTADGKRLVVANHLPRGCADTGSIAAEVSILDVGTNKVVATAALPNGSTALRGLCLSPDGRYAYVTHILGHYQIPTTQLERGWMCTNALSILDVAGGKWLNTVLLDHVDLGAANPWGVACTADGKSLVVALAGTHEVEVIDRPAMHERLDRAAAGEKVSDATSSAADVANDLEFLAGLRRRIRVAGNGPRGLAVVGSRACVAEYFSDSVGLIDLRGERPEKPRSIALTTAAVSAARRGEMLFNNAERCFQHWQSCASCHPDGRADCLNWDLLNDGAGNPKNTRNMLLSPVTPPMMSLSAREGVEPAVASGFKVIQFTTPARRRGERGGRLPQGDEAGAQSGAGQGRTQPAGPARPAGLQHGRLCRLPSGAAVHQPAFLRPGHRHGARSRQGDRHADADRGLAHRTVSARRSGRHASGAVRHAQTWRGGEVERRGSGRPDRVCPVVVAWQQGNRGRLLAG